MKGRGTGIRDQGSEDAGGPSRFFSAAIILAAAAIATAPILFHGSYCGDDFEFHFVSWLDVQQSWRHGIFYPHWMSSANYGAGEPRFLFYPPLSWMLGAALGFILPWPLVAPALVFLALAGTGLATRALARQYLRKAPATLAGCAAIFSGFALFTAYERTAFAELTGGFWIPLLLLFCLRDRNPSGSIRQRTLDGSTLPLALVVAGCWLSNGPVGVMGSYLLAAVAIAASLLGRTWTHLFRASIAAALGIAVDACYLIPAAREQSWADLRAAIDYPVFRIENNWLFARHADPFWAPFDQVLHRASLIGTTMISVTVLSFLLLVFRKKYLNKSAPDPFFSAISSSNSSRFNPILKLQSGWMLLSSIPIVVLFLQLPISHSVWNLLPKLRYLQYPWRWVLVVEAPMSILFAAAIWPSQSVKHRQRVGVAILCGLFFLTATGFAARTFLRACREGDTAADLLAEYQSGGGLEGTDEYEPAGSDHWKIATGLPDACFSTDSDTPLGVANEPNGIPEWRSEQQSCQVTASAPSRQPERLDIHMVAPRNGYAILRLVRYPAWRLIVNGKPVAPVDSREDGLIAVPVPQGPVTLSAIWTTTPDVIAGRGVSAIGLLLSIGLGWLEYQRREWLEMGYS